MNNEELYGYYKSELSRLKEKLEEFHSCTEYEQKIAIENGWLEAIESEIFECEENLLYYSELANYIAY